MKTLRAGYYAGEFGHHLLRWQAIIRHKAQGYEKVIIGCEPQYRFLYEDFATEFVNFPYHVNSRNMWMTNGMVYPMLGADIQPSRKICMDMAIHQDFIRWGKTKPNYKFDILIHARSTDNLATGYRNWSCTRWKDLAHLYREFTVACIGSENGSLYIPSTVDARGLKLSQLADIMASSSMLLSPSSGPAHFASLCGLKHIVWSDSNRVGIMDNEKRYKDTWSPFKTECEYIPTWQPTVEMVCKKVEKWL